MKQRYEYDYVKISLIDGYSGQAYNDSKEDETIALIALVELNRADKLNAMDDKFYDEIRRCFRELSNDDRVRSVVLTGGSCKYFTAGLDFKDPILLSLLTGDLETGRRALKIANLVKRWQSAFTAIEQCRKPVLVGIHNWCIGAGIDMITACDVRYCTEDVKFSVKEVDIGLAADLGTLQRLTKVCGNQSMVRELCFTARSFDSAEAQRLGLVSKVFKDRREMFAELLKLARELALKSPIAILSTKQALNHARDHSVAEGLEFIANWNASMLQSTDVIQSVIGAGKKQIKYSKL